MRVLSATYAKLRLRPRISGLQDHTEPVDTLHTHRSLAECSDSPETGLSWLLPASGLYLGPSAESPHLDAAQMLRSPALLALSTKGISGQ